MKREPLSHKQVTASGIEFTLKPKDGFWSLRWTDPREHRQRRRSTGIRVAGDVELKAAISTGHQFFENYIPGQTNGTVKVADLIDACLKHKQNHQPRDFQEKRRNWTLRLRDKFGSWDHADLTYDVLEDYKKWCQGLPVTDKDSSLLRGWKPITQSTGISFDKEGVERTVELGVISKNTINLDLALISKAYNDGIKAGSITVKPWIRKWGKKELPVRTGKLEFWEVDRIMALDPPAPLWLRAMIQVYNEAGNRAGELRNLTVGQITSLMVDGKRAHGFELENGDVKNKKGRFVPFGEFAWSLVSQLVKGKGPDELVFTRTDRGGRERPIGDFRKLWADVLERAGINRWVLLHDNRRSAVSNQEEAGVDRGTGMSIVGHQTAEIYDRYNVTNKQRAVKAMRKVEAWKESQRNGGAAPVSQEVAALQRQLAEAAEREQRMAAALEAMQAAIAALGKADSAASSPFLVRSGGKSTGNPSEVVVN